MSRYYGCNPERVTDSAKTGEQNMILKRIFAAMGLSLLILSMPAMAAVDWGVAQEDRFENAKLIVDPPIGRETTREIGESLVSSGIRTMRVRTHWKVTLKEDASGKMGFLSMFRQVKASAGTSGSLLWHSSKKTPMFCVNPQGNGEVRPSEMAGCFVDTDKDGKFDALAFPGYDTDKDLDRPIAYELVALESSEEIESRDSYFVEVLYQGISRGEVKISYREFKGGIARPAFTQDVTYELEPDGSGMVAFRGLRIKIVKATRENITYVVQQLGSARV